MLSRLERLRQERASGATMAELGAREGISKQRVGQLLREKRKSPWTDAALVERLCSDWERGFSITEIGVRLGVSRNAVVSKAHRLNLPARPSPIRRKALEVSNA